jgi:mutator protein MutT
MKAIEVGCAMIRRGGKWLIAQRKAGGHLGGHWEFPGGKRCEGETLEDCLVLEVREELGIGIRPVKLLRTVRYSYPDRELVLDFYLCDWAEGEPQALDCADFRWVLPDELAGFTFPPADAEIIRELEEGKYLRLYG